MIAQPLFAIQAVIQMAVQLDPHWIVFPPLPGLTEQLHQHAVMRCFGNSEMQDGVYIVQVVQGGAGDKAGLQKGDRILSFDGEEVSTSAEVKAILREHKIGDQVEMVIERDGQTKTVTITLGQQSA